MKIENLEVGKSYNYTSLCKTLGVSKRQGEYKTLHIAEIHRYVKFESIYDFNVIEIYERPMSLEEVFENGLPLPKYKPMEQTARHVLYLELSKEKNLLEVGEFDSMLRIDTKRYWWNCWRCKRTFYASPRERLKYPFKLTDEETKCHCCGLSKNASSILEYLANESIKTVLEYSFRDLLGVGGKPLRFDFAIFNKNEELIALIEYDGEYHDEDLNPNYENYLYVNTHDKMKDGYCEKNNIPLLRIHHSKFNNFMETIEDFFKNIEAHDDLYEDGCNKIEQAYLDIIERINNIKTFKNIDYKTINKINAELDYREDYFEF